MHETVAAALLSFEEIAFFLTTMRVVADPSVYLVWRIYAYQVESSVTPQAGIGLAGRAMGGR